MTTRAWGNEFRNITVCVDSYENGVLSGRFYNPYLTKGRRFRSLTQFLLEVEQALGAMDFPRSFNERRSFYDKPPSKISLIENEHNMGELATFSLRVIFRQNSSWQGSILWQERESEQSFRSALELILLMDDALSKNKKQQVS